MGVMTTTNTYLHFNGNCAEAMQFYKKVLGGKLNILKQKDTPMGKDSPYGKPDDVMHASLEFGGGTIMASDWITNEKYPGMNAFEICLMVPTVQEAKKLFDALSKDGKIKMPLNKTAWVEAFAMFVDRFGTPWMINGGKSLM